jgi:hypothetical protein
VVKFISVDNLPEGYTAILGTDDNDTIRIKGKKIYAKYYIKIFDSFGREVKDFLSNHRLATGLDISFKLSNIDSPSIVIKKDGDKLGYFGAENEAFNITVYDDKPFTVSSSKASSPDNADPSTWWVIGGIIAGVIVVVLIIYLYYTFSYKKQISENTVPVWTGMGVERMAKTPRFPPRYYNVKYS